MVISFRVTVGGSRGKRRKKCLHSGLLTLREFVLKSLKSENSLKYVSRGLFLLWTNNTVVYYVVGRQFIRSSMYVRGCHCYAYYV